VLQALLGHKSAVETWDTYGHLMGDEDVRSRQIMDSLLAEGQPPLRTVEGGGAVSAVHHATHAAPPDRQF
jgi:hypothetical protein